MSSVLVVTFAFVTEIVPQAAAGAMAVENLMRNPAAAIAAVVAPPLIARMGYGWYFTGFGILDVVLFGTGALCESKPPRPLHLTIRQSSSTCHIF